MGPEWVVAIVAAVVATILAILKGMWGSDSPQQTTVDHPTPDIEVTDGKTDEDRLSDLGL